jgi:hypothetical protein
MPGSVTSVSWLQLGRMALDQALKTAWVRLDLKNGRKRKKTVVVGGVYREWSGSTEDRSKVVAAIDAEMIAA